MGELPGDPFYTSRGLLPLLDKGDQILERLAPRIPGLDWLLVNYPLTTRGLLISMAALCLVLLLPPLIDKTLRRTRHVESNFRGDAIPQSFGIAVLLGAASLLWLTRLLYPEQADALSLWLIAVVGFGLLGLLDDLRGDKKIKGLRGHFRAAFRERRITTGFLKAVGGMGLALWIGMHLFPETPLRALLATLLIALSANAINLLDLRPGRAGAVFLLASMITLLLAYRNEFRGLHPLLFVILPLLPVWERDAGGRAMMGDAGSNLLGASLGLALAGLPPGYGVAALTLLIGLHLLTEKLSLSALIERTPLLRFLDRLTGIR